MTSKRRVGRGTAALSIVPTAVEEPKPDLIAIQIVLAYLVDGAPALHAQFRTEMPRMPADQDALQLQIGIDARQLLQLLEPKVGPTVASVVEAKPAPKRRAKNGPGTKTGPVVAH